MVGVAINVSHENVAHALREDVAKLRRMTTGNRELDAVAQILGRVVDMIAELEGRLRAEASTGATGSKFGHVRKYADGSN